jgi:hypothetical protein
MWAATLVAFGVLINGVPYLLTGNISALVDGFRFIQQEGNPQPLIEIMSFQFYSLMQAGVVIRYWFYALLVFLAICVCRTWLRTGPSPYSLLSVLPIDFLFGAVLSPLLLEGTILSKHFWAHYQQLFMPYFVVSSGFMMAYLIKKTDAVHRWEIMVTRHYYYISRILPIMLCIGLFVLCAVLNRGIGEVVDRSRSINYREREFMAVSEYLKGEGINKNDFLSPTNMYLHWRFDVTRHGFPHARNTYHIFKGWWENRKVFSSQDLPTSEDEYCDELERRGPFIIVEDELSPVLRCFHHSGTRYGEERVIKTDRHNLVVYRRRIP